MKELLLKTIKTKKLKKNEIFDICKLKNTHWKYGVKSHLNWFKKHIQDNDIHNMAYIKERLVGYVLLRCRKFPSKKKKIKLLIF